MNIAGIFFGLKLTLLNLKPPCVMIILPSFSHIL